MQKRFHNVPTVSLSSNLDTTAIFQMINKYKLNFNGEDRELILTTAQTVPMGAMLVQLGEKIPLVQVRCSASYIHKGTNDHFIIVGGDGGVYVINKNDRNQTFIELHSRQC